MYLCTIETGSDSKMDKENDECSQLSLCINFEEFSKDESRTEDVSIVESDTYKAKY